MQDDGKAGKVSKRVQKGCVLKVFDGLGFNIAALVLRLSVFRGAVLNLRHVGALTFRAVSRELSYIAI